MYRLTMTENLQNGNRTSKVIPAPFAKKNGRRPPPRKPARNLKAGVKRPPIKNKNAKTLRFGKHSISFLILVVLPTMLVGVYYAIFAADQYMVETRFSVRSATASLGGGLLGSLGFGLGGGSSNDTFIILEYIHSRGILKNIDERIGLKKRYRKPANDFYAALPDDIADEDFLDYWKSMVKVSLDQTSHILTVKIFAFTPGDAKDIASAILSESERMINILSEKARQDAVAYALSEVRKAEKRVQAVRQKFLKFRNATQQIDPAKQAQVQVLLVGKLEEQLVTLRTKLAETRSYLSEKAPSVIFLRNRIKAVKEQIAAEKRKLGKKTADKSGGAEHDARGSMDDGSLSKTLSEYEALVVEREFAEKFYISALKGLEEARLLANRQQRYLATFEQPYLPDSALYPKRFRNTMFVFLALSLIWGLGSLMTQSIRDRM